MLDRLAAAQHRSPWLFLLVAAVVSAAMFPLVKRLRLNSDFTALLPEKAPSVHDLDQIEKRVSGLATLSLAVSGDDLDQIRAFVRALAPRLEKMKDEKVVAVDWNVDDFKQFVEKHLVYASEADLDRARVELEKRMTWEKKHANPVYVDLEDTPPPDTKAVIDGIIKDKKSDNAELDRFPQGFFQHPKEKLVLIFVRTALVGGEIEGVEKLLGAIRGDIAELAPKNLRVDFGGDVMDAYEEQIALTDAALLSLAITVGLVVLSILIFYFRVRAVLLLFTALVPPLMITFGVGALLVTYLNASTAFLSSIVIGNGINPCIVWLARYFEARRRGVNVGEAVREAHHGTWRGTLTASLAAATSYGALVFTDFRGFRDFGVIGGIGMTLCWVSTILVLPALCVATERIREVKLSSRSGGWLGGLFARLALRSPGTVALVAGLIAVNATMAIVIAIKRDPLEYDFRKLESRREPSSKVRWVNTKQGEIVDETTTGSGIAILAPTAADARALEQRFDAERADYPHAYGAIRTLDDLLPQDQEKKWPALAQLRKVLLKMREYADDPELADIDRWMPPEHPSLVTAADIPATVARPFIEKDGTRGRLLYMEHDPTESQYDGRYLIRWTAAARTALVDHKRPPIAGRPPVFADLQQSIFVDGPKAVAIALGATILLVFFTFGRMRDRLFTLGSLLLGVVVMAGACAACGLKLNFLNFVAFPVTFGIGSDYGVNVMRRFVEEEGAGRDVRAAIRAAVSETGGAVILCSLTTIIGYLSLFTSPNRALNSFGLAMVISEVACLLAAVLALPAVMAILLRKRHSASS